MSEGDQPRFADGRDPSRRDLLKGTLLGAATLAGASLAGQATARAQQVVIFEDDFEDDTAGEFPSGWTDAGGGAQEVVTDTAATGTQSLQQTGVAYGCHEAVAYHRLERDGATIRLSGSVRPTDEETGNCFDHRGTVGLQTSADGPDAGDHQRLLTFRLNGTVTGVNGSGLGEYDVGEWNDFELLYEETGGRTTVTYTINGDDRGTTSLPTPSYAGDLGWLRLGSSDGTVSWDGFRAVDASDATASESTVRGRVVGPDGEPISGATATVPLSGNPVTATTGPDGEFTVSIRDRTAPETVTLLVDAEGFVTGSVNVTTTGGSEVTVRLRRSEPTTVQISDEIHHIGDGSFGGQINSQFQEPVEGESVSRDFALAAGQAEATSAELIYTIRGAQHENRLYINDQQVGVTDTSAQDGSASSQRQSVDPSVLREGANTFRAQAVDNPRSFGDIDDLEISNVRLRLTGVDISIGMQLADTRLVQTVGNTGLDPNTDDDSVARRIDDPDLVVGRRAAVTFDINGQNLQYADGPARLRVTLHRGDDTEEFTREFDSRVLRSAVENDHPSGVLWAYVVQQSMTGDLSPYPTFELTDDVDRVEVTVALPAASIESSTTLEPAPVSMPPFRLGIIGIQHDGEYRTLEPASDYRETVLAFAEFVQRTFPTHRVELYYQDRDAAVTGSTNRTNVPGYGGATYGQFVDAQEARIELESHLPVSRGDAESGTVTAIEGGTEVSESERSGITIDEFDATLAVVPGCGGPKATDSGTCTSYFAYHSYDADGVHFGGTPGENVFQPPMTPLIKDYADVGRSGGGGGQRSGGAHEIGHHLLHDIYSGQLGQDDEGERDPAHANTALKSVMYDIEDGTIDTGSVFDERPSFMSYSGVIEWTDSVAYQHMIDESFSPTPREAIERYDDEGGVGRAVWKVVDFVARKTGDGIDFVETSLRDVGSFVSTVDDGNVTVTSENAAGDELRTSTLQSGVSATATNQASSGSGSDLIVGSVPVPEQTTTMSVEAEVDGETAADSITPVSRTLVDMIRSLPDAAFAGDREDTVDDVVDDVEDAGDDIADGEFAAALETFTSVEQRLQADLQSYDDGPNQPSKQAVIARVTERIEWLKRRQGENSAGLGSLLSKWGPIAAGGVGAGSVAAGGAYWYLRGGDDGDGDGSAADGAGGGTDGAETRSEAESAVDPRAVAEAADERSGQYVADRQRRPDE